MESIFLIFNTTLRSVLFHHQVHHIKTKIFNHSLLVTFNTTIYTIVYDKKSSKYNPTIIETKTEEIILSCIIIVGHKTNCRSEVKQNRKIPLITN